jgi:hypothetical protein
MGGGGLTRRGAAAVAGAGAAAVGGTAERRRRRPVDKSAFGVEGARVPTAAGRLKPVPPASAARVQPTRRLDAAITATRGTTS